jgi:hypothetical protein
MGKFSRKRRRPKLTFKTFRNGIEGKVLAAVRVTNELNCRSISLEFDDNTELSINLDTRLTGKLELFDWKSGNQELVRKIGALPSETTS